MNNKLKQFFDFNKKERIGVISLMVILVILIVIYYSMPQLVKTNPEKMNEQFKKQVQAFIEARKKEEKVQAKQKKDTFRKSIKKPITLNPFPFDPNDLPVDKWKKMGFSAKQIQIIKNYEKSGGHFYSKSDLKKIYGISQAEYKQLEPYIKIHKETESTQVRDSRDDTVKKKQPEPKFHIDLNSGDSSQLIKVNGIGKVFSARIVKYRNFLGGFYKKEQLLEVYSFDSSNFQKVKKYFWVDSTKIRKIHLNRATFKELLQHPYLDYYLVKQIVNYREENGGYKKLSELKNLDLMYDDLFEKLKHYLTLS